MDNNVILSFRRLLLLQLVLNTKLITDQTWVL